MTITPPPKQNSSPSPPIPHTSQTPNHNPIPPSHTPTPSSHTPTTPPSHTPTPPLPDHFPILPLPIQQQFDRLQHSTTMQIESLASSFAQRIDQLLSLYNASPPPPPNSHASSSHHTRPPPPPPPPPPFHTYIPPPEFGSFRGTPLRFDTGPVNSPEFGAFRGPQIRLDTPKFDGTDPAGWLYRIGEYFDFYATPPNDRLRLVGLCMEGQASDWFRWTRNNGLLHSWEDFVTQVQVRFDPDHFEDYVGALSKLRHTTTVSAYQSDFERLLNKVTGVSESTLISVFISGLKPQLRRELNLRRPSTLTVTFALARELSALHIDTGPTHSTQQRRSWSTPTSSTSTALSPDPTATIAPQSSGGTLRPSPAAVRPDIPIRRLSYAEKLAKDAEGLCYNCDQKWSRSHRCQSRLLLLIGDDDDIITDSDPPSADFDSDTVQADISSLHSLSGSPHPRALRLKGSIDSHSVTVLIDGGSTHNFVHPRIVEQLQLPLSPISPFRVYVGNGDSIPCRHQAKAVPLTLQEHHFPVDLYVLSIHGPDVVLGVQWLQTLGKVTHDYANLTMEFSFNGVALCLHGDPMATKAISLHTLHSLQAAAAISEYYEFYILDEIPSQGPQSLELPSDLPSSVCSILEQHNAVFSTPHGLPPHRLFDHRIFLQPGTKPINVRPYRYPHFQKAEIEKMVQEMLTQGIIRLSTSPFSSPVLLVKKKDGTFRFCVDYRALNAATVPDHFPIPTADELFDELGAARVFTKLDLRSGYHQIRMHDRDIYKTAFRTHEGHFEFLVMPFGLTNAPSSFQACMNHLFRPYLRKFIIVFFDDILIYSPSLETHVEHLSTTLGLLLTNNFFVKSSKCSFCRSSIDYLGHVISNGSLVADPTKIHSMISWPVPTTVTQLRGFLGLTGYYRRFVKDYSTMAAPLTDLLRADSFLWSEESSTAFNALKQAMSSAPVLKLPDFSKTFIVETDASDTGVGAVLLQDDHPVAYFSKKLGPRRRAASTYHKELYAIVESVQKWRQYLLGRHFLIRTDQRSLRELLHQVIQTPDQHFYVRKLMGFRFTIEYKQGASNRVADALSRREDHPASAQFLASFCQPPPSMVAVLRQENQSLQDLQHYHKLAIDGSLPAPFSVHDGLLFYNHRICIGATSALIPHIIQECHSTLTAGHPGIDRTFHRVATSFYWPRMRADIRRFVKACYTCQITKASHQPPGGLLQPLSVPACVWDEVTMDFITGLPPSRGSSVIMVVVDRLSKYAHFGALPSSFDAHRVAALFVDIVVKLHGFPSIIVSDRDPIFVSAFWDELFRLSGTTLKRSSAYHPQTDGQSEVMNRGLEQYLRAFTHQRPNRWTVLLPWAEYSLNTSFHSGIKMTPFQALYGRLPPSLIPYQPRASKLPAVDNILQERSELLLQLRNNLLVAQQRMKCIADRHRRDISFNVGDMVLLKLQPYRQHSVARPLSKKLGQRYYGPFQVLDKIGNVAYRLKLPDNAKIHPVFHVSLLRPYVGPMPPASLSPLPSDFVADRPRSVPVAALKQRTILQHGVPELQWLVQWSDGSLDDASWEPAQLLQQNFPDLHLAVEAHSDPGGNVTNSAPISSPSQLHTSPTHSTTPAITDATTFPTVLKARPTRSIKKPLHLKDYV